MALKESEVRVLAILGLVILVLWSFFGLFWSLLLVFTFLIYAYNFGRHQAGNTRREHEEEDSENDLSYQEKLRSTYQEPPDLPFTGLPREKVSLRSPMPLLSEVTKRLSFNTSSTTPFQGRNSLYNRELIPTPYPSRGNTFTYHRKPKHFSLLNPALQRPSTVKIASPDVTVNRTFTLSNSPLKRAADDWNPCSRVTVLSALKESRKRSFVVEDEEDEIMRPTKRRDIKQVDSHPFGSPLFASRKRVAIPESTKTTPDENFNKKSKVLSHSDSSERLQIETSVQKDSAQQKRKNRDSGTEKINRVDNLDCTETGEDESSNKKSKFIDQRNPSETVHSQRQTESVVQKRKDKDTETEKTNISQQGDAKEVCKGNQSKNAKGLVQQAKDDKAQRGRSEQATIDNSSSPKQTKRFTVPRFASKEDSRRRAVPVYCASNEESEMPQRRTVSRKINQEQIKIDRRLAWERVKELLGGDEDDEEEEEETAGASKTGTTAVLSTAAGASTSSSLLKIPTAGAMTSAGTITTTTTQSLITPAPSTGVPQRTAGAQGGPALQSQGTAVPLLQSQQASAGPGLLANLLSNPGSSKNTSSAKGSQTVTSEQAQSAVTAQTSGVVNLSKAPTIGLQANVSLASTVTATQGPAGLQLLASSTSSFGNSPFTKPAITNQLTSSSASSHKNTSDTNTSSAQQASFSFPAVSSLGSSGTTSTAAGQGGFTFAAASGAQNTVSLGQNSTQNTSGTSLFNSPSTSTFGAASSQKPASLSGSSSSAPPPNPFASFAMPTQNSSASSATPATSGFGQSSNAAQSSFGSTGQNKLTFGATNMQSVLGQQSQSPFGGTASNTSGFGATSAQNTFGAAVGKSSTQSPFSQGTLGAQANQNSSQGPAQNVFGAQQQNPQPTASAFGKLPGKSAFANLTNTQGNFTFGSQVQQSATQNIFGSRTTQNAFGSQPNQNTTQGTFGNQATQNAFGAQASQSAFGASSTQKTSSPFTFVANAVQNASNTPFGGFSKTGTQSTLGAAPSQNAAAPSGGFNFNATGSSPAPGGFNFNATANKQSGFQFGAAGSSGNFGQLGQTTAQPGAAPSTPTPSGGFNFASGSGGMPGSPFASPAAAPTFGVPSTPQGTGSTLTARSRARIAARRRGKK